MSKQLLATLILIIILVAGATMLFLSRGTASPQNEPTVGESAPGGGFPTTKDRAHAAKNGDATTQPLRGDDIKTGNGFLSKSGKNEKFQKLVSDGVAGAIVLPRGQKDARSLFVRYVERATGHIKEVAFGQQEGSRVANTTFPKVVEAVFSPSGANLVLRALTDPFNQMTTVLARVATASSSLEAVGNLEGVAIPEAVSAFAVSPNGGEVFTLVSEKDGAHGILQTIGGKNRREIFRSPLAEWQVEWTGNAIALTTKPSENVPGYLFFLSPGSGAVFRVLGGLPGLTAKVSPDDTRVLYTTTSAKNGPQTFLYTPSIDMRAAFPLATLAEKCVWSNKTAALFCALPEGAASLRELPDAWYRGDVFFNDTFWKIDAKTLTTTFMGAPEESVDGIRLFLSPDEDALFFIDKRNGSLWGVML